MTKTPSDVFQYKIKPIAKETLKCSTNLNNNSKINSGRYSNIEP